MTSHVIEVETTGAETYPVHIEPGSFSQLPSFCEQYAPAHRYAVIADSQVAQRFGNTVLAGFREAGLTVELVTFPAGEWNKSRAQWAAVSDKILRFGFGRDSTFVALGGGVTGDLAGFVAATYMRGVPVIQVPTTLLAMIDSSVGGKTGVDTEIGKNLIGAFHHPSAVVVDPQVLDSLPKHQVRAGLAEATKTAAILDRPLWGWIEEHAAELANAEPHLIAELVGRVVRHKADVVAADPMDRGRREILNYGHTVGHAIEALEGYRVLHGEAVAAGMRVEARLGEMLGVTEEGTADAVAVVLDKCGLGELWEHERRPDEVLEGMMRDKKVRAGRIRCVLLERIGRVARDGDGRYSFILEEEHLGEPFCVALAGG